MKRLSEDTKKPLLKETFKEIENLINNQNFLVQHLRKSDPVTPCMYVCKAKIQPDGSLDKLKLRMMDFEIILWQMRLNKKQECIS